MVRTCTILCGLLFGIATLVHGQQQGIKTPADTVAPAVLGSVTIDDDTLPLFDISAVEVFPKPHFKNRRQARRYSRYIYNVKKVYPYARYLGAFLLQMEHHLDTVHSEKERRKYIKGKEKELKSRFEDDVWNMTFSQGKILLKLIDREAGRSSYAILYEMKGAFSATFWQTIARIFGSDLKTQFDPTGEDRILNQIVIMIEAGRL